MKINRRKAADNFHWMAGLFYGRFQGQGVASAAYDEADGGFGPPNQPDDETLVAAKMTGI
jgi:hypothetical protein